MHDFAMFRFYFRREENDLDKYPLWRFNFPKNHDDGHMTTFVRVRVYEEKRLNLYIYVNTLKCR